MESLLRAVLTSPDPPQPNSIIKQDKASQTASPYLHAALTATLLKPRMARKPSNLVANITNVETRKESVPDSVCKKTSLTTNRHRKLLEALTSNHNFCISRTPEKAYGVALPIRSNNGRTSVNDPKASTSLNKSRLFMALTSPLEYLSRESINKNSHKPDIIWNKADNEPLPENNDRRGRSENTSFTMTTGQGLANNEVLGKISHFVKPVKSELLDDDNSLLSMSLGEQSETLIKVGNISNEMAIAVTSGNSLSPSNGKERSKGGEFFLNIKKEPVMGTKKELNASYGVTANNQNIRNENVNITSMNTVSKPESQLKHSEIEAHTNLVGLSRHIAAEVTSPNNKVNGFSKVAFIKTELESGVWQIPMEKPVTYAVPVKHERPETNGATESSFKIAMLTDRLRLRLKPPNLVSDAEVSLNMRPSGISVAKKRKLVDNCRSRIENADPAILAEDPASSYLDHLTCKKRKTETVRCQNTLTENTKDTGTSSLDNLLGLLSEYTAPRSSNSIKKIPSVDTQILRRVLTEGTIETKSDTLRQPAVYSNKSTIQHQSKDRSPTLPYLSNPVVTSQRNAAGSTQINLDLNVKPAVKSQILRAALISSEPIPSAKKTNCGSTPFTLLNITLNVVESEVNASGSYSSSTRMCSSVKNQRNTASNFETPPSVLGNQEINGNTKNTSSSKNNSQLLLAALTAADVSRKAPISEQSGTAHKQTNSEILRAALNSAEKDSKSMRAKHSQLLRAALIAVDTNTAAKNNNQMSPKLTNSRLLRAVLTGKYIPELERQVDHSKTLFQNTDKSKSPSSVPYRSISHSFDTVEITPNLGNNAASEEKTKTIVGSSINCTTRPSSHSILRAVLTGAIDIPQRTVEVTRNSDVVVPDTKDISLKWTKAVENYNSSKVSKRASDQPHLSSLSTLSENSAKDKCTYCGHFHCRDATLWEYTSLFAEEKLHSCYMCNQSFSVTCLFLQHVDKHNKIGTKYKCEFCGRYFTYILSYIMCRMSHMDSQKEKYSCEVCDSKFECRNKLNQHSRLHAKDTFNCKFCGEGFQQQISCYLHETIHTNKMNFTCKMCGEKFSHGHDLKVHYETHYNDNLFQCSLCTKCFVTRKELKIHTELHLNIPAYICSKCKNCFVCKGDLDIHQCTISKGKNRLQCDSCGASHCNKRSLAKHKVFCLRKQYADTKFQLDPVSHSLLMVKD